MAAKAPVKKNLSALKRARQSEKRNERNRNERSKVKSAVKSVETAIKENKPQEAGTALLQAVKTISAARAKGIIHKNNASRKISRLTKKVTASAKPA